MQLDDLERFWKRVQKRPVRMITFGAVILLLVVATMWASGFFGELGRQWAAISGNDNANVGESPELKPSKPVAIQKDDKPSKLPQELRDTRTEPAMTGDASAITLDEENHEDIPYTADQMINKQVGQQVAIRERSAAEVVRRVQAIETSGEFSRKLRALYVGRWTREPGWQATVQELPSPNQSSREEWDCRLKEVDSSTIIWVTTAQDVSALRPGDTVTVSGRINRVSILGSVSLEHAIIASDAK